MNKLFVAFGFLFFILGIPFQVAAQRFSFSISPSTYEIITKKGQTITLPYSISNIGDPTLTHLQVYAFYPKDSQGTYDIVPLDRQANASTFIFAVDNPNVTLEKPFLFQTNRTHTFNLTITVPPDAPEKDYYFALIAETEEQNGFSNSDAIILSGAIGSVIYMTVTENGAIIREPSISLFNIKKVNPLMFDIGKYTVVNSFQPIPVVLSLVNKGTNFLTVSGSIIYDNYFSKKLNDKELQKKQLELLENPGQENENVYPIRPQPLLASSQKVLKTLKEPVCSSKEIQVCSDDNTIVLPGKFAGLYRISTVVSTNALNTPELREERLIIFFPFYLFIPVGLVLILLGVKRDRSK